MKKLTYIVMLAVSLLNNIVYAKENKIEEKWVGVFWKNGEEPIVTPILFNSKKKCMDLLKEMNNTTKDTVKISRKIVCSNVINK